MTLFEVVRQKDEDNLKRLWSVVEASGRYQHVLSVAVSLASQPMASWMLQNRRHDIQLSLDEAAGRGDIDYIKWAHARGAVATTQAMDLAAGRRHFDTLKWLHANRTEGCTWDAISTATAAGDLDIVQWLWENRGEGFTGYALFRAATSGHLTILKWLMSVNADVQCPTQTFEYVCALGHYDVAKYLTEARIGGESEIAIDLAAKNGYLRIVDYCANSRIEGCTVDAMNKAASSGFLDIVKYLHEIAVKAAQPQPWTVQRRTVILIFSNTSMKCGMKVAHSELL